MDQPLNHFRNLVQITGEDLAEMPTSAVKVAARGDGDCLIHACILSTPSKGSRLDSGQDMQSFLRMSMVQVMRDEYDLFERVYKQLNPPIAVESEEEEEEKVDPFDDYLESISKSGTYCDDICVTALCIVIKAEIHVYRQQLGTPLVAVQSHLRSIRGMWVADYMA